MDCIFCRIAARQMPARILCETDYSVSFMDAHPLTRGHALVIPKRHHEKINDIPRDEYADLFEAVRLLLPGIDGITGSTLLAIHNGRDSGQEIPHVHVHLVPRSPRDGAGAIHTMFQNPPGPDNADSLFDSIKRRL